MRVRVLGAVELERDGAPLAVGGPQQRRLLAFLVVNRGRSVSSGRLVDALWPDGDAPDGAARSIRTYMSRLRVVLPEGSITTNGSGYGLDTSELVVDADEFDALLDAAERAVPDVALVHYDDARALWRDMPFGEFCGEWWALAEGNRLFERRVLSEEQRAALLMTIGHHNRAIPELERLVVEHPLRERPVVLLMQALHVTGRRAEALRVGEAFRVRLVEQTGLDPSSELAQITSSIIVDDELVGQSTDRPLRGYVLHGAIGEGAHGRVYEATQPGTDRRVAIKVIRPDLADTARFVRRFDAEARLIARLEHPHIVPLYDYWREPGGAYLVFRLLTGGTVRDSIVIGGAWSIDRVSRLVEEVGGALISAHATGVVHNDVKASNVLLDGDGAAFLTDFGIAVSRDGPALDESAHQVDRLDFAWLVWELLTGAGHARGGASVAARAGSAPPPNLIDHVRNPPDGLNALFEEAGAVDGSIRSVAEFVLAWRAAVGPAVGTRTPLTSSDRRAAASTRRGAAQQLALDASAGVNPYRGLSSFDEADAAGFFGRDDIVDHLVTVLDSTRLVTIVGPSGSGKSSVVRAGLIPRVRERGDVVATMVPGDDPLGSLHEALGEVATAESALGAGTDGVGRPSGALTHVAERFGRLVVFVDQLEECWTRAPDDRREAFFDVVASVLAHPTADVRFVTTVRADVLDRPLEHPGLGPQVGVGIVVLPPLSPSGLSEAVTRPAERVGVGFEEGVVADLVVEAVAHPGSLPLLQFALTELYDRRVDGVIGRVALDEIGGIAGAIGQRGEDVHAALDGTERDDARALFARLVVPHNADGERDLPDARRRARMSEFSPGMREVADRFVTARLLVTDTDPATREPTFELAHEALLSRWPRLSAWVDEDGRWLQQVQHLSAAARSWDERGRADADLYRGARLEAAIEAMDSNGRTVAPLERVFVEAGRRQRDSELVTARRTAQRLHRRLTAVAVALVVALVAGLVAFMQRQTATESADAARAAERAAQVEALVGRAESLKATQRDSAALLAIEAFRLADTPTTRSALFGTFTDDERFLDAHRFEGDLGSSGIVMPGGTSAYLTAADGRVHPYDLNSGALGTALPPVGEGDRFSVLAASPSGDRLVVAARSDPAVGPSTVGVFDTAIGALIFPPSAMDGVVTSVAFLPDNRIALAIGEAGRVVVIDATNGSQQATLPALDVAADDVIWTLDPADGGVGPELRRPSSIAVAGDQLLVGSADGALRLFDSTTLALRHTLERPPETLSTLWPLSDGTVVTAGRLGSARFELETNDVRWQNTEFGRCLALTVDEKSGRLFCGDSYGRLDERDLDDGAVMRHLDAQNGSSGSLWLAHGGTELVSFGRDEPVASRWRLDGSGPITHVVAPGWTPYDFDPSGDMLVLEQGELSAGTYRTAVVEHAVGTVTVLDGPAFASWVQEGSLFGFWRDQTGAAVFARRETVGGRPAGDLVLTDTVVERALEISAPEIDTGKERMLITYGRPGDQLRTLHPETLEYGPTIDVDGLVSWAVSRAGDRVVAGTANGVVVFDGNTGEVVGTLHAPDLRAVVVTVTDQLFVGSRGGELTQYDLVTLRPIRTFGGSRGHVHDGAGTADGSLLATNGGDRIAALYDVASGTRLGGPITIGADERNAVHLSLDGRWLAVGGQAALFDDVVRSDAAENGTQIWNLDPDAWIRAACALAGRNLTRDEWSTHIGDLAPYRSTCPT